jgi:uncharacterized protein (DUF1330 family)
MKKGYIIVRLSVTDSDLFQEYPPLSSTAMEKYGGKYLIRGGKFDVLEGEWQVDRTTVVEFESYEKAKQCYQSPEYSKARDVRKKSAKSDFILIEGF